MDAAFVLGSAKLAGGLTALGVIALVLAVAGLYYISRDRELAGSTKTMWIVLVLFFPIIGPLVYFFLWFAATGDLEGRRFGRWRRHRFGLSRFRRKLLQCLTAERDQSAGEQAGEQENAPPGPESAVRRPPGCQEDDAPASAPQAIA